MADLYAAANQDSGVSSYISAASPAPSTGFGHGLGVGQPPSDLSHHPPPPPHMLKSRLAAHLTSLVKSVFSPLFVLRVL